MAEGTPETDPELGPFEEVPSAVEDPEAEGLPEPLVDPDRLISGGPPADGIPAIVDPRFEEPGDVDWLQESEPVLAVSLEGVDRAYPVRVMIWHEIVNDELGGVPVAVTTWAAWRDSHPDGEVLSQDTGHERAYGSNPYVGYDEPGTDPFLYDGEADPRMPAKDRVVGLGEGDDATAVPVEGVEDNAVAVAEVGGEPVTVWIEPGVASALDTGTIERGREIAATGVFRPEADGRELEFEPTADGFTDTATASTWTIFGEAVAGPLEGERLPEVDHVDTFWFSWVAFTPETDVAPAPVE